jgi:homogentisate 1,2-dioxygenase
MPFYQKLGEIPNKRHTVFRQENGELYHEQLFGTAGFDGMSTLMYHIQPPTVIKEVRGQKDIAPEVAVERNMLPRSFKGYQITPSKDYLESRNPVLVNSDVYIELAAPQASMKEYFYKNADADEVIFIHRGTGKLRTQLGNIDFAYGDYLVIPRGMIYQLEFENDDNRLLIIQAVK